MAGRPDDIEDSRALAGFWYWAPVVLYAGAIFYLSSQSHPERYVPDLFSLTFGDKILHAIEYAVLGQLCYRAFRHASGAWGRQYAVWFAVVAATIYGATDEWHQAFVPLRESDPFDLATDFAGALAGVVAWSRIATRATVLPDNGTGARDGRRDQNAHQA